MTGGGKPARETPIVPLANDAAGVRLGAKQNRARAPTGASIPTHPDLKYILWRNARRRLKLGVSTAAPQRAVSHRTHADESQEFIDRV